MSNTVCEGNHTGSQCVTHMLPPEGRTAPHKSSEETHANTHTRSQLFVTHPARPYVQRTQKDKCLKCEN